MWKANWAIDSMSVGCFSKRSKWQFSYFRIFVGYFSSPSENAWLMVFDLRFFRIVSNYSPESFALLARFLERRISITIYVKAMWFYATQIFLVRFSSLCLHLFHFVNISLCVTHDVRRDSLYANVLISRAESSFLLPEVTVFSCSITGFCTCNISGSIFGGLICVSCHIQNSFNIEMG